jgi:flavodoxin I
LASLGSVDVIDVAKNGIAGMSQYDLVILGTSTWGCGDMQDDWEPYADLPNINLAGRKAAVFGLGDQRGFSDTFVDAMARLAASLETAGATLIGSWLTDGYGLSGSLAVRNGKFVGLALDEDSQSELTAGRLSAWTRQLIVEF